MTKLRDVGRRSGRRITLVHTHLDYSSLLIVLSVLCSRFNTLIIKQKVSSISNLTLGVAAGSSD